MIPGQIMLGMVLFQELKWDTYLLFHNNLFSRSPDPSKEALLQGPRTSCWSAESSMVKLPELIFIRKLLRSSTAKLRSQRLDVKRVERLERLVWFEEFVEVFFFFFLGVVNLSCFFVYITK